MICDRWTASSALQKAIRRGDAVTARRAALTLLQHDRAALWRRLLVIAAEDMGVGSIGTLVEVARLAADARSRRRFGSEDRCAAHACKRLAAAPKDRSTDHLFAAAAHWPTLDAVRNECGVAAIPERLAIVAEVTRPLSERAVAAWYASGVENWPERRVGKGDLDGLMRVFADLGCSGDLIEATAIAARRTRAPICVFLPLLALAAADGGYVEQVDTRKSASVGGVPLCALDGHTRMGRQAIAQFLRSNAEVADFLAANVPDYRAEKALRLAVFYADSAPISVRFNWRDQTALERLGVAADFSRVRADLGVADDLIEIVRRNLDHLDALRTDLLTSALAFNP
ncbi:hypothetical protein GGD83_004886 [Rhodoblastus sphagnicola]|uniref:hypothetical protein n=1 Tax=Rhodoblastus sphagnicola TaxID=333368 RepID=UPI000CEC9F9C|nr:hypothetical protein [Rhodoblastus sphagnicola]MBB4201056.1 hypothetical protein [Rhodoblastus sphagnicola]